MYLLRVAMRGCGGESETRLRDFRLVRSDSLHSFPPQDAPDYRFQKATADSDCLRSMPQLFRTRARGSSSSGSHFASKPYTFTSSATKTARDWN
jgi:hypothetical protein